MLIPFYARKWYAAVNAREVRDWEGVIANLGELHERDLATDESYHWLGCALAGLARWSEAVEAFEGIRGRLSDAESEGRRYYNHAYSLAKLDRIEDAKRVLESSRKGSALPNVAKLRELLEFLEQGGNVSELPVSE